MTDEEHGEKLRISLSEIEKIHSVYTLGREVHFVTEDFRKYFVSQEDGRYGMYRKTPDGPVLMNYACGEMPYPIANPKTMDRHVVRMWFCALAGRGLVELVKESGQVVGGDLGYLIERLKPAELAVLMGVQFNDPSPCKGGCELRKDCPFSVNIDLIGECRWGRIYGR
jgi:hypothetical protein